MTMTHASLASPEAVDYRIQQLKNTQYLHEFAPGTLLPIELASILIGLSVATIRTYVTTDPRKLPVITKVGGKIQFRKGDIDTFVESCRQILPEKKTQGRPTKVEQRRREMERLAAGGAA